MIPKMDGWMDECYRARVGTPTRGTQGSKGLEVAIYEAKNQEDNRAFGDKAGERAIQELYFRGC